MATSPNFGWLEPDNTDLVKNGALAIRTAVDAIDTSMGDLLGGTTGQVLTKATDTDMDFTWSAGASVPTSYGFAAGKNKIINGDFNINQRGFSSTTTSGTFGFDRWATQTTDGTVTYSAQTFTAGTAPVVGYESTNFARVLTTGQTLVSASTFFQQKIEDVRTFANQTVTVSFWAKAATGTPKIAVELDQQFGSGGSTRVTTYGGQVTLSTSWARYSVTFTGATVVPSISGKTIGAGSFISTNLWVSAGSNFNSRSGTLGIQSNTFDFWGVQVEAGSTATAFQTATGTIQGELAACQRYYYRNNSEVSGGSFGIAGMSYTTTRTVLTGIHPVPMRTAPSVAVSGCAVVDAGGTRRSVTGYGNNGITSKAVGVYVDVASGLTAAQGNILYGAGTSTTDYVEASAEL